MKMKNNIRFQVDADLSKVTWTMHDQYAVMNRIREGGHEPVKKKVSFTAVLVAAILAIGATVAFAATVMQRYITINQKGDIIETQDVEMQPEVTSTPEPVANQEFDWAQLHEYVDNAPEEQYVQAMTESGGVARKPERKIFSESEFADLIAGCDYLTQPSFIPEGYHFESATIMLGCNENGEYIQEELRQEGNTYFARYSIAANSETMIGYEVIYRNEEGQYVSIYDQLSESDTDEEHLFSFPGEYVYRAENIPDMEYAISMQGNNHNSLCMMKTLRNSIVCRWYPEKTKIDDQDGMMPDYFTYQSEEIDISSNSIDIEVLVSMFSK